MHGDGVIQFMIQNLTPVAKEVVPGGRSKPALVARNLIRVK